MGGSSWCLSFYRKPRESGVICRTCFAILIIFISFSVKSIALEKSLIEVGRLGDTESTKKYFSIVAKNRVSPNVEKIQEMINEVRGNFSKNNIFPLVSNLEPGFFKSYRFDLPKKGVKPFSVIGTDELSLRWLKLRYQKLVELRSPVFVIEATSEEEIKKLEQLFPYLKFTPASSDISNELNIGVYPYLVTSQGVFQ